MANSAPKRRKLKIKPDRNGIDRLSNLPEHLLLHILSFLPTETATSTSILSKSWQFLWTLVINLDFDQSRSHPRHTHYRESFANFVKKVLLHRRERFIGRFRLKCHSYQYASDVDSWVSSAMAQNVQELELDLGPKLMSHCYHPKFMSQYCTQNSWKHLVVLKLRPVVLDEVSFPALKIFHLEAAEDTKLEVGYQEIKFLPSQFPVLEELVIVHKYGYNKANFEICLPKLRSLAIDKSTRKGFVRIDCPALTHLVIEDENSREYHLQNQLSLVEADIKVKPHQVWYKKDESYGRYVMDVVKAISNVRIMRIFHLTIKETELDDIPVFHNLVQVELPFVGTKNIILMLQKFQRLECLILWYEGAHWKGRSWGTGHPRVETKELIKQNRIPSCLTSRLTAFCFRKFEGTINETEVTRYILENSRVLEYATIFVSYRLDSSGKHRVIRNVHESPTASKGCQIDIFDEKRM